MRKIFVLLLGVFSIVETPAQNNFLGEKMTYKVSKDGSGVASVNISTDAQTTLQNNQSCYKIVVVGKITAILGLVEFENKIISWIETNKLRPQKLHAYFNDGKKANNFITEYNHQEAKAISYTQEKPSEKKKTTFTKETQDIFSAFYYLRQSNLKSLKVNELLNIQLMTEPEKVENISLKYLGKKPMNLYNGSKECYIFGLTKPSYIEGVEVASVRLAITSDEKQLPAKIYAKTNQGFVILELEKYSK